MSDITIEEFACQTKFIYLNVVLPFKKPWAEEKAEKKSNLDSVTNRNDTLKIFTGIKK
jgi:hypothetical protein